YEDRGALEEPEAARGCTEGRRQRGAAELDSEPNARGRDRAAARAALGAFAARLPERLVGRGRRVCQAGRNEEKVREAVQVHGYERIDVVLTGRRERVAFGAPAHGSGDMEPGGGFSSAGKHEAA